MREFYEQVGVDDIEYRFYAECHLCGKRRYGRRLPFLCRSSRTVALVSVGRADRLRQHSYNKSIATSVQELACCFNLCRHCGSWVCDDCFRREISDGICAKCEARIEKEDYHGIS